MKTFIGTGVGQPETAVHQAVQGLTSPSAILFMASYEHFKETASRLRSFLDTSVSERSVLETCKRTGE